MEVDVNIRLWSLYVQERTLLAGKRVGGTQCLDGQFGAA
jgi:hypothetical protein